MNIGCEIFYKKNLADFCTFKTGGEAEFFVVVKNLEELKQAVSFAKQKNLPIFVLGGGSNLLISDDGVKGLVIKMEMKGILCGTDAELCGLDAETKTIEVIAGAGEVWDELVEKCVEENLTGLENLSYIPGTVGASAVQNIGAYGVEVKDVIEWVEVFDIETGEIKKLTGRSCKFGYRDSVFKKPAGKNLIVIRVAYNLQKFEEGITQLKTDYKDIQEFLSSSSSSLRATKERGNPASLNITPKQLREAIIKIRQNKLPDWKKVGTAGSFFKNPVISENQLNQLLKKYPNLPHFPQPDIQTKNGVSGTPLFKIPLAFVLDKILGMKGYREGNVGLYENQPLALTNYGGAVTQDIKNLAQKIQKEVKEKIGVDIDFEVVEW